VRGRVRIRRPVRSRVMQIHGRRARTKEEKLPSTSGSATSIPCS
jgi:hypothetical protein